MNKVILCGRLTKDPDVRYSQGEKTMAIARYSLAIDRYKDGTDYPSIIAFGKQGEFAEKYLKKGMKILVEGRIQTGSYEKDGKKIYTTDVVVDRHEFVEPKQEYSQEPPKPDDNDSFMEIPEGAQDELPFNW